MLPKIQTECSQGILPIDCPPACLPPPNPSPPFSQPRMFTAQIVFKFLRVWHAHLWCTVTASLSDCMLLYLLEQTVFEVIRSKMPVPCDGTNVGNFVQSGQGALSALNPNATASTVMYGTSASSLTSMASGTSEVSFFFFLLTMLLLTCHADSNACTHKNSER